MDLFTPSPTQVHKSAPRAEGRSLPFSEDGEKGVLCSLLLSPRTVLDLCQIKLRPEAFYGPAHHTVYIVVAELVDANKPGNYPTLAGWWHVLRGISIYVIADAGMVSHSVLKQFGRIEKRLNKRPEYRTNWEKAKPQNDR